MDMTVNTSPYLQIFTDKDLSVVDKICDPNIKVHTLLLSQELDGVDAFKKDLEGLYEGAFQRQPITAIQADMLCEYHSRTLIRHKSRCRIYREGLIIHIQLYFVHLEGDF